MTTSRFLVAMSSSALLSLANLGQVFRRVPIQIEGGALQKPFNIDPKLAQGPRGPVLLDGGFGCESLSSDAFAKSQLGRAPDPCRPSK